MKTTQECFLSQKWSRLHPMANTKYERVIKMTNETSVKKSVSANDFIAAYKQAVANGETNEQLATRLGIKLGSLSVKLTDYRSRLREKGLSDDQVKRILPSLKRPTVSRRGSVDDVLDALISENLAELTEPTVAEA